MKTLKQRKNEEAIELLADILEPATEIFTDPEITGAISNDHETLGKVVIKAVKKHAKAVVQILCAIDGIAYEEANYTAPAIISKVMEIIQDEELTGFFSSLVPTTSQTSSGTATDNTQAGDR